MTTRYVYNGANQIQCVDDVSADGLCDDGEFPWQYDVYGNLLNDGTSQYTYDAAMQLKTVTSGGVTTTYQYNGDGDRVSQTVGSTTTTYVIDTATPLTMVLAETTGTTTILYLHGLDLVAQSDGASTEYLMYDGLGSVRQVITGTSAILVAQSFDPYGNLYSRAGADESNFGFTGELVDDNGLVFLRARYYNPAQGRFMQMDPSRMETNPYQYGFSNPVNYVDPSGLCPEYDGTNFKAYGDCIAIVGQLERAYGFIIYWPNRPRNSERLTERGINLEAWLEGGVLEWCEDTGQLPTSRGIIAPFKRWTYSELALMRVGLEKLDIALGHNFVRNLTKDGVIFRTELNQGSLGFTCPGGNCKGGSMYWVGADYAIGYRDIFDVHTVVHEYGHVSHYRLNQFNLETHVTQYADWQVIFLARFSVLDITVARPFRVGHAQRVT